MISKKLAVSLSILVCFALTFANFQTADAAPSRAPESALLGTWIAKDVDGSQMQMTISYNSYHVYDIVWRDTYWSICDRGLGIGRGTGAYVDIFTVDARIIVRCLTDGSILPVNLLLKYNPVTQKMWDGLVEWTRID